MCSDALEFYVESSYSLDYITVLIDVKMWKPTIKVVDRRLRERPASGRNLLNMKSLEPVFCRTHDCHHLCCQLSTPARFTFDLVFGFMYFNS